MAFTRLRLSTVAVVIFVFLVCVDNANLSHERMSSTYEVRNYDLSGVQIWATAPEGNLTQGEVTFKTTNGHLLFDTGFGVDILTSLQIALKFSIKVIPTKGWATQYPNGSWFGMAKEILDGNADIAVAKTSLLPNRAKALSYLVPIHGLGLYAFFVQPSSNRNIFLDPFEIHLWLCIILTYLMLIGSVKLLAILTRFSTGLSSADEVMAAESTIWSFYTISQQGYHCTPKLTCLRIALLSGVVLGLVIYISYAATLVSMFSIESVPIKSLKDLLASKIRITIDANNQAANNLIQANESMNSHAVSSVLQKRLKEPTKFPRMITAAQGGIHVLKAHIAFLTFKDTFYTTARNTYGVGDSEFCGRITAIPVTDVKFKSGLFVPKGSPLKEPFNTKIIAMYNFGLMNRFVSNYEETYTPTCDPIHLSRTTPSISFSNVEFAFYGIACGFFCAILIYFVEFVHYKRCHKKLPFQNNLILLSNCINNLK